MNKKNKRQNIMAALFAKAKEFGISSEELRDQISLEVIKKRISKATNQDLGRLLDHLTGLYGRGKKYESSRAGLVAELEDTARERWGDDYEAALNKFINANRKTETHYRFLNVKGLKALVRRIKELQGE